MTTATKYGWRRTEMTAWVVGTLVIASVLFTCVLYRSGTREVLPRPAIDRPAPMSDPVANVYVTIEHEESVLSVVKQKLKNHDAKPIVSIRFVEVDEEIPCVFTGRR